MNRFNLEDAIMAAEQVQHDLALLHEAVLDWPEAMSDDELSNYIAGIESVTKLRQAKLWDVFKREFELDEYRPVRKSWTEDLFEDSELDVERELSGCDSGLNNCDDCDSCPNIPNFIKKDAE